MVHIVKLAMKRTPETLTEDDRLQLAGWLGEASVLWAATQSAVPNARWWGLDEEGLEQVAAMETEVGEALDALSLALNGGDAAAVLEAVKGIKPPFAKLFMSFGTFPEGAGPAEKGE
jgi:hypothetical protein